MLAPSPALQLHASNALSPLRVNEPFAQFRALIYAVRWELGIGHPEFLDSSLEGDRWLVLAAGDVCDSEYFINLTSYSFRIVGRTNCCTTIGSCCAAECDQRL